MTTFTKTFSYLTVSAILFSGAVLASDNKNDDHSHEKEHRQHDAHVHGAAKLTIVSEGKELLIELHSPAMNILGFEHSPKNDQQKALIVKTGNILSNIDNVITLPASSKCELEHAEIEGDLFTQYNSTVQGKHDEHDEHDEHEKNDGHDEHDEHEKNDGHEEHDGHDEHDGDDEAPHSDVSVHYELHCQHPEQLTQLDITAFEHFTHMEKVEVQALIEDKQLAKQLTAKKHLFKL